MKKYLLSVKTKGENYLNALKKVNALGDIYTNGQSLEGYDGLILCGGSDMHPKFYNEEICGSENIDLDRDIAEFKLIEYFLTKNKPILAVCRGFQILNVYLGGTLIQHLKTVENHRVNNGLDTYHIVTASKDSVFYNLYGERFKVNSYHHQAVKKLSNELTPTCFSLDGVIEGYESKKLKILGVQFHPERLTNDFETNGAIDGTLIFKKFLEY